MSTPEQRAAELAEMRAWNIHKMNRLGMWDTLMRRAMREAGREAVRAGREAARGGLENTMDYDPRGRTPQGRAEQLAEMRAADRRAADLAHQPGSAATSPYDRAGYWEHRLAGYEARWDRQDRRWRAARADAGEFPDPAEAAEVAALDAERTRLSGECSRARRLRDEALGECDRIRREIW